MHTVDLLRKHMFAIFEHSRERFSEILRMHRMVVRLLLYELGRHVEWSTLDGRENLEGHFALRKSHGGFFAPEPPEIAPQDSEMATTYKITRLPNICPHANGTASTILKTRAFREERHGH